jgi:hypothetical protein
MIKAIKSASLVAVLVFGGITVHAQIGISPTTALILDHRLGTSSDVWKSSSGVSPTIGGIVFGFFTGSFYSNKLFGSSLFNSDIFFASDILTNYNFDGSSREEVLQNKGFRDFRSFSVYGLVPTLGDWSSEANEIRDSTFSGDNWGIDSLTGHNWDTTQNYEIPSSGGLKTLRFEDSQTQTLFYLPP